MSLLPPGAHGGDGARLAAALGIEPGAVLDLSASLNPVGPDWRPIVERHLRALRSYPDDEAAAALAEALGVAPERVVLTNGGAEAIALVAAELPVGWVDEPDFSLYRRHLGRLDPAGPRWQSDPRNPTGRLVPPDDVAGVRDEAFHVLATGRWTRGDAGAVVVGSLTKAFACPGLRLGYVLVPEGDLGLAERVRARRPAWSVNGLAAAVLPELLALADPGAWCRSIASLREELVAVLRGAGVEPEPSDANYVWIPDAGDLRERLLPHGVLVRDGASFGVPGAARVAVPDERGLARLEDALRRPGRRPPPGSTAGGRWPIPAVPALDPAAMAAAEARWSTRAEPPGALGRLEALAVQVAGITGTCPPPVPRRAAVVVFAADHGAVLDGASAWPQEVTAAMVATMAGGGAAINALAAAVGAEVHLVDVGVATPLPPALGVQRRAVRAGGTASIARGWAMTPEEAAAAVDVGREVAAALVAAGVDLLAGGDMGIGNTTASAALIARFTGADPAAVTGRGAGVPSGGLAQKEAIVRAAVERAAPLSAPLDVLACAGGLEIAALAGLYLETAARRVPVVVDGVIAAAALCAAEALAPGVAARCIAGHRSTEPAATIALDHLGLVPLLELDLRLGEGTGACLALPLVRAAVAALRDMAALP